MENIKKREAYWQDEGNINKIKRIYGEEREDQFARETLGILKEGKTACFEAEMINQLFAAPRESIRRAARYVFVTIDPSGGTKSPETAISDFSLISHCIPGMQICGWEAFPCVNSDDYEDRILEHIRRIKLNPMLRDATVICAIEGNLGMEANHLQKFIQRTYPAARFLTNQGPKHGVKTSEETKSSMANIFDRALRSEEISIIREFITTDPEPAKLLDKARRQLLNYARLTVPAKTPFEATRVHFSGKGKNIRDKDDMSVVAQLALYWSQRYVIDHESLLLCTNHPVGSSLPASSSIYTAKMFPVLDYVDSLHIPGVMSRSIRNDGGLCLLVKVVNTHQIAAVRLKLGYVCMGFPVKIQVWDGYDQITLL